MDREKKWDKSSITTPNAWRHIFLMNEFNELQMDSNISMEFTILFYVFLMQGEGLQYFSNYDPNFTTTMTNSPNAYVLYFF